MFSADQYVKLFIDNNWLSLSIFLLLLKGLARQFKINPLHKAYLILQNALAILRPGTSADTLAGEKNQKQNPPETQ
jgi:hypothetical protein